MQFDPIKSTLKPPETKRLKLEYYELLSNFALKFNLRRYSWAVWMAASMLRRHEGAFLALVDAMQAGAPVADCLKAIEAAEKPNN